MRPAQRHADAALLQRMTPARRTRVNNALNEALLGVGAPFKRWLRDDLKAFVGDRLSKFQITNVVSGKRLRVGGGTDALVAEWVEARLVRAMKEGEFPSSAIWRASDALDQANPMPESPRIMSALAALLKMKSEHYKVLTQPKIGKEFFGYRRSTSRGDIIRFYIRVAYDAETNLYSFLNRYNRDKTCWEVNGFGFDVGNVCYLFGHAQAETEYREGLGLRLFALTADSYGWFTGPLLSMNPTPHETLAAQVVLIPADQHKSYRRLRKKHLLIERREEMIQTEIKPSDLKREIEIVQGGVVLKPPIDVHLMIQAAIFNGTFSTLRKQPLPDGAM